MISREKIVTAASSVRPGDLRGETVCVLLVEDDPASRRYLEIVLSRAGYGVLTAADGLEAMRALMSAKVDLVVTDAMMPNLNGYELGRFVKSSANLSHLPVVLLSALDPRNAVADAEQVDAFLSKPVTPDNLLSCLEELFSRLAG